QGAGVQLNLAAGDFTVLGPAESNISDLTISGGTLDGPANLNATHSLNWTAGGLYGTGVLTIPRGANGVVAPTGSDPSVFMETRTLDIQGTLTQNDGNIAGSYVAFVYNEGTLNLNGENFSGGDS